MSFEGDMPADCKEECFSKAQNGARYGRHALKRTLPFVGIAGWGDKRKRIGKAAMAATGLLLLAGTAFAIDCPT